MNETLDGLNTQIVILQEQFQMINDSHTELLSMLKQYQEQSYNVSTQLQNAISSTNIAWTLLCSVLVFGMQIGFTALEAGGIARKRLIDSILLKNAIDICISALCFYLIGYGFAFGENSILPSFVGSGFWALTQNPPLQEWVFQWTYASTSTTVVSGAIAERSRLRAHAYYSVFNTCFTYPIAAHWAWSPNGWMSAKKQQLLLSNGFLDFAGSAVVHILGGATASVATWILQKRIGRFEDYYERRGMFRPHNTGYMTVGTLLLWFSWYGFNCGATRHISDGFADVASHVAVATTLSAASSALVALLWRKIIDKKWDLVSFLNGIIIGLVSITAGCAFVNLWASIVIGIVAGTIYHFGSRSLFALKLDDVLEVTVVHLYGGIWGSIAVGLFASKELVYKVYGRVSFDGLFLGGGFGQLGMQVVGSIAVFSWACFWSFALFTLLRCSGQLRIDREYEEELFNEAVTKMEAKAQLASIIHNYQRDRLKGQYYIRRVDDMDSISESNQMQYAIDSSSSSNSPSSFTSSSSDSQHGGSQNHPFRKPPKQKKQKSKESTNNNIAYTPANVQGQSYDEKDSSKETLSNTVVIEGNDDSSDQAFSENSDVPSKKNNALEIDISQNRSESNVRTRSVIAKKESTYNTKNENPKQKKRRSLSRPISNFTGVIQFPPEKQQSCTITVDEQTNTVFIDGDDGDSDDSDDSVDEGDGSGNNNVNRKVTGDKSHTEETKRQPQFKFQAPKQQNRATWKSSATDAETELETFKQEPPGKFSFTPKRKNVESSQDS